MRNIVQNFCFIAVKEEITTLGYKNITLFILLGVKASVGMWDTDRKTDSQRQTETEGDNDRLLYWPIASSSLDHIILCYSSRPQLTLLLFS